MNTERWWPCQLRGRSHELRLVERELRRVTDGAGAVVVVTGGAGIGKTRLLAEARSLALHMGLRAGSVTADPSSSAVELSALLSALFDGREPLLSRDDLPSVPIRPDQRFWLLRDVEALLEKAALASPLLVCVDDAQWVDAGTAAALRELPLRLRDAPVAWVIAARPGLEPTPLARTLEYLDRHDLCRLPLEVLPAETVNAITAEILGAEPGRNVRALTDKADGNPFLLVETLLGLTEEERVEIADGVAEVRETVLPRRVALKMRERLAHLSPPARDAVIVAASLSRRFFFADLARMLDQPTAELLAPVGELLDADLFVEHDAGLAFWHDITRDAVRGTVPASARAALDRQAAAVLLERGALPVEVAHQLAASAEPGDETAISTLLQAAKAVLATDAASAADFGRRALDLAPRLHPLRGEIVSVTAVALHAAGDSAEAIGFTDAALRETLPATQEAQVRLGIANMFAISPDVRAAASREALSLPDIPAPMRTAHSASLAYNLLVAGRLEEARRALPAARAASELASDPRASITLDVTEGGIACAEGRFDAAYAMFSNAARASLAAGADSVVRMMQLYRGEIHSHFDREDEAFAIAREGLATAQRDRQADSYKMYENWQAWLCLRSGRLSEASAMFEGIFEFEDGRRAVTSWHGGGLCAMTRAALHTGDTRQLRRALDIARVIIETGTPANQRHAAWMLALTALADGDTAAARTWLTSLEGPPVLPRFPEDVTDPMILAGIAVATSDDALGGIALDVARQRAAANAASQAIRATAVYVQGLLANDEDDLQAAADGFKECRRPLEQAMATEALGARRLAARQESGAAVLGEALTLYTDLGAAWDARRVRSRLRDLGIRRRVIAREPATRGWGAMTEAEAAVARLVAEGLTNREVAEQLFLSPHTVNSHLRHVFSKLGVKSRVELTRLALRAEDGPQAPAATR